MHYMIVFITIAVFLTVINSLENDSTAFIGRIASTLAKFCPHQDEAKLDKLTEGVDYSGSCCTEFFNSNDTSSLLTKPVYDVHSFQTCLYLQSEFPSPRDPVRSYYVVVEAPQDGCQKRPISFEERTGDDLDINEPRCDDAVVPWRRLYPVFSKSSGLIYKNPNCAFCHGVYDLVYWKSAKKCSRFSYSPTDTGDCEVIFVYPGNQDDIVHLQCFMGHFATCGLDDFHVASEINLSKDDIWQACQMETLPPFNNMYFSKNFFCYLCANFLFPVNKCIHIDINDYILRSFSVAFSSIIDNRFLNKFGDQKGAREIPLACLNFGMTTECKPIVCPLGQVRIDGSCRVTDVQWGGIKFKVHLVLSGDNTISVSGNDLKAFVASGQLRSPWGKRWKLLSISRKVLSIPRETLSRKKIFTVETTNKTTTNQLWVVLYYDLPTFNPQLLLREVETTMKKTWDLVIPIGNVTFKQQFSRYKANYMQFARSTGNHLMFSPICCHEIHRHGMPPLEHIPIFEYVELSFLRDSFTNTLHSLFFCPQVELPASYFIQFKQGIIFNNVTDFLHDNEFYNMTDGKGVKFRVCVSKFKISDTNDACRPSLMNFVLFCLTVSMLILGRI